MKGYVYMIDYRYDYCKELDYYMTADQCKCNDKQEMLTQLKYLLKDNDSKIERVKLVKDDDRWVEKQISDSLQRQVDKLIKEYQGDK